MITTGVMRDSQVNFKMLKNTNHQLKALAYKTSKVVCTQSDFHMKLKMANVPENSETVP